MSKLTEREEEQLDVAENALQRLLSLYKQKPRKGKDLERLKLLEAAANNVTAARLTR